MPAYLRLAGMQSWILFLAICSFPACLGVLRCLQGPKRASILPFQSLLWNRTGNRGVTHWCRQSLRLQSFWSCWSERRDKRFPWAAGARLRCRSPRSTRSRSGTRTANTWAGLPARGGEHTVTARSTHLNLVIPNRGFFLVSFNISHC